MVKDDATGIVNSYKPVNHWICETPNMIPSETDGFFLILTQKVRAAAEVNPPLSGLSPTSPCPRANSVKGKSSRRWRTGSAPVCVEPKCQLFPSAHSCWLRGIASVYSAWFQGWESAALGDTCQSFVWKGPPSPCCWRLFLGCHCLPRLTTPPPRLTEIKTCSFLNLQIIKQLFFSSFRFHISHLCLQSGLHMGVEGKHCSWVWGSQEESQAVRPLPHPCPELGTEAPCLGHLLLARYCS